MRIERIGTTKRWSDAVIYNHTLYMVEVPVTLATGIEEQAKELLQLIEKNLKAHGSNKSRLLTVTIFLKDIRDIDLFNALWDEWLPKDSAPVRVCIEAKLANPEYLVEIQLTAALDENNISTVNFMT